MSVAYFGNRPVSAMKWGNRDVSALAMGGTKFWEKPSSKLPYTQLEYLQGTGTQYINSGIYSDNDIGAQIDYTDETTTTTASRIPMGSYADGTRFYLPYRGNDYNAWYGWGGAYNTTGVTWLTSTRITSSINFYNDRKVIYGDTEISITYDATENVTLPIYIFKSSYSAHAIQSGKMYSVYVTKGFELIRNYIPVVLTEDVSASTDILGSTDGVAGEYGLWDLINSCFFGNIGTGTFTGGEPLDEDTILSSLTISDGAYFDTGYYPIPSATDTDCQMSVNSDATTTQCVFGARDGTPSTGLSANIFYNVSSNNMLRLDLLGSSSLYSNTMTLGALFDFKNYSQSKQVVVDGKTVTGTASMSSERISGVYCIGSMWSTSLISSNTCDMTVGAYWNISEWVDGVEVPQRSYVPVIRGSDGLVCLKNTLDGTYCEAVGGTVTAGDPV